ncbi:MAG: anion permease [Thermofilum sp.]|nr:anion permease [Thermofilum sp.]
MPLDKKATSLIILVVAAVMIGLLLYYITPVMGEGVYRGALHIGCDGEEEVVLFNFTIGKGSKAVAKTERVRVCGVETYVKLSVPEVDGVKLARTFNVGVLLNASGVDYERVRLRLVLVSPGGYSFAYVPLSFDKVRGEAKFTIKTLYRTKEAAFIFGSAVILFIGSSIIPFVVTSIYLTLALYLAGAITLAEPFTLYMSDTCLVFLAGSALELVIKNTGLGMRIASALRSLAESPSSLFLSTMLIGGFISMWMSNTSATYLLLPIVASLASGAGIEDTKLYELVLAGLAVGTTIGGSATLVGTPPNLIAGGYLNTNVYSAHVITFSNWVMWGLPYFALSAVIAYVTFLLMYRVAGAREAEVVRARLKRFVAAHEGGARWSRGEVLGLVGILFLVGMWVTESIHGIKTGVAGMLGLLVFLTLGVLKAKDIKSLGWDIVILMGGGLTLGRGLVDTGFSDALVQLFTPYMVAPTVLIWLVGLSSLMLGTFMSSHTAGVAFLCPIVAPVGYVIGPALGLKPESGAALVVILSTLALDTAVALPISTPPSAIVFGTGKVRIKTLLLYGMLFGIVTVALTLYLLPPLIIYALPR